MVANHERGVIGTRSIENIGIIHARIVVLAIRLIQKASDTLLGSTRFLLHTHKLALLDFVCGHGVHWVRDLFLEWIIGEEDLTSCSTLSLHLSQMWEDAENDILVTENSQIRFLNVKVTFRDVLYDIIQVGDFFLLI